VLLDQVILGVQRGDFARQHQKFDVGDQAAQRQRLGVGHAVIEVTAHTAVQVDGLSDVDHRPVLVFHQVAAGFARQVLEDRLNVFGGNKSHFNTPELLQLAGVNWGQFYRKMGLTSPPAPLQLERGASD
jgi:hypothetical protein